MQRPSHPSILPAGRQRKILDAIRAAGAVTVDELVLLLGVSESTVRRDLDQLSEKGLLSRTHGGAVPPAFSTAYESSYADKKNLCADEKRRIGKFAASCVSDGDTLILDAGSTTFEVARELFEHRRLTILTYDLAIAALTDYHPSTSVFLAGGAVRRGFNVTLGSDTEAFFRNVRVNKAFLGADAIDVTDGLFNATFTEQSIKQLIIKAAQEVILVADRTKFKKTALTKICDLSTINRIVTDKDLCANVENELRERGVDVVKV